MRFIGLLLHTRVLGAGVPMLAGLLLLLAKILILAAIARVVPGGGRGER